jgi:hypothetical protein
MDNERGVVLVATEIPVAIYDILQKYCDEHDRTKAWVIRSLLVSWANAQRKKSNK